MWLIFLELANAKMLVGWVVEDIFEMFDSVPSIRILFCLEDSLSLWGLQSLR